MNTEGSKPRCALRVGVIGNRHFGDDKTSTVAAERMKEHAVVALEAIWQAFFASIGTVLDHVISRPHGKGELLMRDLFSSERPRLAVLTSLAAGADQIGASTALGAAQRQTNISLELEALLPMGEDDYPGLPSAPRKEFRPEEAESLRMLAARACQVVRLPGDYLTDESREHAYRQASDLLVQNSDILIAIYNPAKRGGKAGTLETIRCALESEIPVIGVISTANEARIQVIRRLECDSQTAIQEQDAYSLEDERWRSSLLACVREQLVLPELTAHEEADDSRDTEEDLDHVLFRLGLIGGTERRPALCRMRIGARIFEGIWEILHRLSLSATRPKFMKRLERTQPRVNDSIVLQPYATFYRLASALAVDYMRTYRGAFVASYFLAGAAVVAAVALMAVSLLTHGRAPLGVILGLGGAKVGILLLLLALERAGHSGRFQEAGADFRYLAELLRPMQWLTPLGTYPAAVDLPLHAVRHDPRRRWMAWLARAVARSSPCIVMNHDDRGCPPLKEISITNDDAAAVLDRARTEWLEGQIIYHWEAASRMHVLDDGLERLAKGLLWAVLACATLACASEMLEGMQNAAVIAHVVSVVLSALAAFLPAWIAAFAGIAFQSEAKRLASRSDTMYHALQLQQQEFAVAARRLRAHGSADSKGISLATTLLKKASAMTIREAGDWKVLYQAHVIHAG